MIVTKMLKVPIFVKEITSYLKQEFECESSTPRGDAAPVSPSPGTKLMPGQGVTWRCLCHLCQGRSCSLEQKSFPGLGEIFPIKVADSDKFQQKIMSVVSQCFVEQSIFCWKILYPLPPRHCPALQSSGSAEAGMGMQRIHSSVPAATPACGLLYGRT